MKSGTELPSRGYASGIYITVLDHYSAICKFSPYLPGRPFCFFSITKLPLHLFPFFTLLAWRDSPFSRKDLSPSKRGAKRTAKHENNYMHTSFSATVRRTSLTSIENYIIYGPNVPLCYYVILYGTESLLSCYVTDMHPRLSFN